jgi:hypothetical protein
MFKEDFLKEVMLKLKPKDNTQGLCEKSEWGLQKVTKF